MHSFFSTDIIIVILFVVVIGIFSLRTAKSSFTVEEYFFADKNLTWPVIGITIIASNISTEHFVAQAGEGYKIGLGVASYEWTASLVMIFVALIVLPLFLRAGIHTLPEYLEYRYNKLSRLYMAFVVLVIYTFVMLPSVIFLGAITLNGIFKIDITLCIAFIGLASGVFSVVGGLNSVVKANIIFGILILLGGIIISTAGIIHLGGIDKFASVHSEKLDSLLPMSNKNIPWTDVFLGGLWVLHFNYWCANQFIVQHSLASKTLSEGQKGILFAATLKLFIPFLIIIPGIISYDLFGDKFVGQEDTVFLNLINVLFPAGFKGFLLAILIGAAISTLHSQVNAATSIFTLDIYNRFIDKKASDEKLVKTGRLFAVAILIFSCIWAPYMIKLGGNDIYERIQSLWGYIAPALFIIFILGIFIKKAPPIAANLTLILNPLIYGLLSFYLNQTSFLDRITITTIILASIFVLLSFIFKLDAPPQIPERNSEIKFERNLVVIIWGIFIFAGIATVYLIFI